MSMKNSNDAIDRTRDLPACSAVPQRTAPPRALIKSCLPLLLPAVPESDYLLANITARCCLQSLRCCTWFSIFTIFHGRQNWLLEIIKPATLCTVFQGTGFDLHHHNHISRRRHVTTHLLPDVFCLMVRTFRLMLVLIHIYIYIYIYIYSGNIPPIMIIGYMNIKIFCRCSLFPSCSR